MKFSSDNLISLAAGIFAGAAVFDSFPEASERLGWSGAITWMIIGIALWYIQKVILRWLERPEMPVLVATALWLHSVLEGIVTGLAFGVSRNFGILIATAMILHLLPEFFAAVGLMKGAGSTTRTSAVTAFTGYAVLFASFGITYAVLPSIDAYLPFAIAISGGAFLYIGVKSFWKRRNFQNALMFLIGAAIPFIQSLL